MFCIIGIHSYKTIKIKKGTATVGSIFGDREEDSVMVFKKCRCDKKQLLVKTNSKTYSVDTDLYMEEFEENCALH